MLTVYTDMYTHFDTYINNITRKKPQAIKQMNALYLFFLNRFIREKINMQDCISLQTLVY